MRIQVELEEWTGSPVVRNRDTDYERKAANEFRDAPARMKPRQAVFYRNLIRIAEAVGSNRLPVDFEVVGRGHVYLDRGCIKIAEHAGFIVPLTEEDGVVTTIELAFRTALHTS